MGRRQGLSTILVLGAIVLVISIFVGQSMGNRVLGQITSKAGADSTPIPIPSTSAEADDTVTSRALWKRRQVLSVATDPAFPDPRITPEPEIPATPRPQPKPKASPTPVPDVTTSAQKTPNTTYTSPPLAFPMGTHAPAEETSAPDEGQTATPKASSRTRAYPTLPPVSVPSGNP